MTYNLIDRKEYFVMRIVADSSCDLYSLDYNDFKTVPLTIYTSEKSFTDDENLNIKEMLDYLEKYNEGEPWQVTVHGVAKSRT